MGYHSYTAMEIAFHKQVHILRTRFAYNLLFSKDSSNSTIVLLDENHYEMNVIPAEELRFSYEEN